MADRSRVLYEGSRGALPRSLQDLRGLGTARLSLFLVATMLLAGPLTGCLSADSTPESTTTGPGATEEREPDEGSSAAGEDEAPEPEVQDDPTNRTEVPSGVRMFRTWGCETTFAMIEVAKSWAAQFTPEGFEPLTFFPARALVPQAPNRTVKASFLIASNHCEEVDLGADHGAAETVTDVNELYYGVFVDPPDEFEDGQKMYVYPFQWVLDDPKVHSVLSAWGIQASPGSVSLAVNAEAGPARSWTVNAQNGNLTAQLDVQTRGAVSAGTGTTTFRIFAAPSDGVVAYAMDYTIEVANSTQNPQGLGSGTALFQISGPGSPAEAPLPSPIGFTRWTPADKVAQRGRLVTL